MNSLVLEIVARKHARVVAVVAGKWQYYSTERQKGYQHLAPVLVIILGSFLVFSRKIITSTGFNSAAPRRVSISSGRK